MNCPECGKEMERNQPIMLTFRPELSQLYIGYSCQCEPGTIFINADDLPKGYARKDYNKIRKQKQKNNDNDSNTDNERWVKLFEGGDEK